MKKENTTSGQNNNADASNIFYVYWSMGAGGLEYGHSILYSIYGFSMVLNYSTISQIHITHIQRLYPRYPIGLQKSRYNPAIMKAFIVYHARTERHRHLYYNIETVNGSSFCTMLLHNINPYAFLGAELLYESLCLSVTLFFKPLYSTTTEYFQKSSLFLYKS